MFALQLKISLRTSFLHKKFREAEDSGGKDPICLDLSGNTETRRMWRKYVIIDLGIESSSIRDIKQTVIYGNHLTL